MAVALKSPSAPSQFERHWSPSDFVDTSSCPSLALNSPVSTMTSDSVSSTFLNTTSEEQSIPVATTMHDSHNWYTSSAPNHYPAFDFEVPYATPQTSSGPFSPPELSKGAEFQHVDPNKVFPGFVPVDVCLPARPRSSPSTFSPISGPRFEDVIWQPSNAFTAYSSPMDPPFAGSTYPPPIRNGHRERGSDSGLHTMMPMDTRGGRSRWPVIAPNPQQTDVRKRSRTSEEPQDETNKRRRTGRTDSVAQELTEEDKLLLQLKDDENLPWKDIAARFQSDLGKTYQIPALQMRLKRLRERLRVWTEADVRALRLAHDYWIQNKYEIIASKMIEFGATDRWTHRQCLRKWQEIDPGPTPYAASYDTPTPSLSGYHTSPQPDANAFLPFLQIPQ